MFSSSVVKHLNKKKNNNIRGLSGSRNCNHLARGRFDSANFTISAQHGPFFLSSVGQGMNDPIDDPRFIDQQH